jgi:hypothetical protein
MMGQNQSQGYEEVLRVILVLKTRDFVDEFSCSNREALIIDVPKHRSMIFW